MLQQHPVALDVVGRRLLSHRQLGIFVVQLRVHDQPIEKGSCGFGRNGGLELVFQANGRNVFQKVQGVAVHRAPAMVLLGGLLSFAVLKLKTGDMRHDGAGAALFVCWPKHVAFPGPVGATAGAHVAADVALVQLLQNPGHVQGFCSCQMLTLSAKHPLFVHDPFMVWKGSFVRCTSAEQRGVATLLLHVEHSVMPNPPVLRRPGRTFEKMTKGNSSTSS